MHPHILMELAHIRTEALVDEARRTAMAARLRRERRLAPPTADRCARCEQAACICSAVT